MIKQLREEIAEWCEGRNYVGRGILFLIIAYTGIKYFVDPMYSSIFSPLNLGIHELGHVLMGIFRNEFLTYAGGTIVQLAVPVISFFVFLRQSDYFAITVSFIWLSSNLYEVSVYIADSRSLSLSYVSIGGGEGYHDWNYMLDRLNLLAYDTVIAGYVKIVATMFMWAGLVYGAWLLWLMLKRRKTATDKE